MMKFSLVVAVDKNNGIGKNQDLAWHLPGEMKHFQTVTTALKDQTKQNAVIMGRKTWESIPEKYRPLPKRLNIVLSSQKIELPSGTLSAKSFNEALQKIPENIENVFVIGGGLVYQEAINHPGCEHIFLTRINHDFHCDTFFPSIDEQKFQEISVSETQEEKGFQYNFYLYSRKNN